MVEKLRRLTRDDWTLAGLDLLESEGHLSVRAERLAKRLRTTRGSFYWHFRDVESFETALLERWRDLILPALSDLLEDAGDRRERLGLLLRRTLTSPRRLEAAFRAWAAVNPRLAVALAAIDERRLDFMEAVLARPGLAPELARARARVVYFAYLGHAMARGTTEEEIELMIEELCRLCD